MPPVTIIVLLKIDGGKAMAWLVILYKAISSHHLCAVALAFRFWELSM